jgi:hypothetical protein
MTSLSRFATTEFRPTGFGGCFLAWPRRIGASSGFPARARAGQFGALTKGANFPHGLAGRSPSSVGFSFHPAIGTTPDLLQPSKGRLLRRPSPHRPHRRTISPVAYRIDLPTVGRRRASPVMTQDHFLQAAARITSVVCCRRSAFPVAERDCGFSSAIHLRVVIVAPRGPQMPSPRVSLLGPFDTSSSPDPPATTCWLLTSGDSCGVRARSSARMRFRTGRLQRRVILLSSLLPFFKRYTQS